MNLKLVVASMSILGLASCPVFAATHADQPMNQKHTYHKVKHHRVVTHHDYKDYKGMEMAPVEVCSISPEALVLRDMTQNKGRAVPNPCSPDWYKRIMVAGGVVVDLGKWGNRNANYMGENYKRLSLNDVYLNVGAMVNDWAHAFISLSYNNATTNDPYASTTTFNVAEYDAAYSDNVRSGSTNTIQVEQAFVTFGNFDQSPFFIQIGKQFQDFGRYMIHPITESFTQVMSKTLATSAKLGFIAGGFNGSVAIFDDPLPRINGTSSPTNYGASLGYEVPNDQFGWGLGVGYLYNIIGVNDIAYQVNQYSINNANLGNPVGYHSRKAGLAAYVNVNMGPFLMGLRYTGALSRFNVLDLPEDGRFDIDPATGAPVVGADGARPWAAGIKLGYRFDNFWGWGCGGYNKVYVGYEKSHEAAGIRLPRNRWLLGASVDAWKSTTVGIEWDNDHDYSTSHGGGQGTTNLVSLRAGVKFG